MSSAYQERDPAARRGRPTRSSIVLTRLHARYGKDITNDLVFKPADPIVGGREHVIDPQHRQARRGPQSSSANNFQARYAIRHQWTGPISVSRSAARALGRTAGGGRRATPARSRRSGSRSRRAAASQLEDAVRPRRAGRSVVKTRATGCGCQSSDPARVARRARARCVSDFSDRAAQPRVSNHRC